MTDLLQVDGISAAYGKVVALKQVSISVKAGEIVAILGANGAGKTTLLNAISGVLPIGGGAILLDGKRIDGRKPWQTSRLGISHVPEGREIFPDMTVEANLRIVDADGGGPSFSVSDIMAMFPRLQQRVAQLAGGLSGGEQQMLAIARAMMSLPEILIIDEPSVGLAPIMVKRTIEKIAELKARTNLTVLMAEQNFTQSIRIADRAYVLRVGRIVREGTAGEIANAADIQEAYLGV